MVRRETDMIVKGGVSLGAEGSVSENGLTSEGSVT